MIDIGLAYQPLTNPLRIVCQPCLIMHVIHVCLLFNSCLSTLDKRRIEDVEKTDGTSGSQLHQVTGVRNTGIESLDIPVNNEGKF
jgi:hypothetical protein